MSLLEIYAYPSLIKPSNEKLLWDFFPSRGKQSKRHFWSTFCPEPSILLMLGLKGEKKYAKLSSYWIKCLRSFSSSKQIQRWRHAAHSNTDLRAIFPIAWLQPAPFPRRREQASGRCIYRAVCVAQTVRGASIRGRAATTALHYLLLHVLPQW